MRKTVCVKYVYMSIFPKKKIKCRKTNKAKVNKKIKIINPMRKKSKKSKKLPIVRIYIRKLLKKQKQVHLPGNQY